VEVEILAWRSSSSLAHLEKCASNKVPMQSTSAKATLHPEDFNSRFPRHLFTISAILGPIFALSKFPNRTMGRRDDGPKVRGSSTYSNNSAQTNREQARTNLVPGNTWDCGSSNSE